MSRTTKIVSVQHRAKSTLKDAATVALRALSTVVGMENYYQRAQDIPSKARAREEHLLTLENKVENPAQAKERREFVAKCYERSGWFANVAAVLDAEREYVRCFVELPAIDTAANTLERDVRHTLRSWLYLNSPRPLVEQQRETVQHLTDVRDEVLSSMYPERHWSQHDLGERTLDELRPGDLEIYREIEEIFNKRIRAISVSTKVKGSSDHWSTPPLVEQELTPEKFRGRLLRDDIAIGQFWKSLDAQMSTGSHTRARSLATSGDVCNIMREEQGARALVRSSNGEPYVVELTWSITRRPKVARSMQPKCSCPIGAREKEWCKHAAALGYVLIAQDSRGVPIAAVRAEKARQLS